MTELNRLLLEAIQESKTYHQIICVFVDDAEIARDLALKMASAVEVDWAEDVDGGFDVWAFNDSHGMDTRWRIRIIQRG
jgi:hypothetical protein